MEIKIDLDKLYTYDSGITVASIIKDEIETVVKAEVRKSLKKDVNVQRAITMLKKKAVEKITKELGIGQ